MTEIFSQLFLKIESVLSDLMSSNFGFVLILIGQGLLMAVFLLLSAYFLIYADRKVWAAVQLRRVQMLWEHSDFCSLVPTC